MPNPLAFDTLAYAKKLKAAGFTDLQAEVQTEALVEIVEGRLATRQNLKETEAGLKLNIESVRSDLKETEAALRRDMKEMEAGLKLDIESVRSDLKETEAALKLDIESIRRDMKEMEQRLTIRLGGLIATSIIIVAALVKLL